jgi:hypothetical protein
MACVRSSRSIAVVALAALGLIALGDGPVLLAGTANQRHESPAAPADDTRTGPPTLWHDPGEIEKMDLTYGPEGPGGAPRPPFRFVEESFAGSNAKIRVTDANSVTWMVKFGGEVSPQTFAARLVSAVGYFAIPTYFVASGTVQGVGPLKRARAHVNVHGRFWNASFERYLDPGTIHWLGDARSWSWSSNPFVGTPELNGLKILVMLLSDWDNKDARDIKRGSNTAILVYPGGETHYAVVDWGGSMGEWGGYLQRDKWQCGDYRRQTHDFVRGVRDNEIQWGYSGQHTKGFTEGVHLNDVHWLLGYLGRISDAQLREGLVSSGASRAGADCFVKAIRNRISQLQSITSRVTPLRAIDPTPSLTATTASRNLLDRRGRRRSGGPAPPRADAHVCVLTHAQRQSGQPGAVRDPCVSCDHGAIDVARGLP